MMRIHDKDGTRRAIRKRREELGLSQSEAADRAGIVQQEWSRHESGDNDMLLETITKIASALECDWYDLVKTKESNDADE